MSQAINTTVELGKDWVGKVVDKKFPLRQWLGASDHSIVFLTERSGGRKAAIKLIPAQKVDEDAQLSQWAGMGHLSHPNLMQLFEFGRCQVDGARFLYVVMEFAEENLGEILPVRPLTPSEASEMLFPVAEALGYLHRFGFVHSRITPSNITAADNQLKLSSDSLRKIDEGKIQEGKIADGKPGVDRKRPPSAYDAPELGITGPTPAADIWSLGRTLVAVLTQNAPKSASGNGSAATVPQSIPQPLNEIARQCLQVDPLRRGRVHDIVRRLRAPSEASIAESEEHRPARSPNRLILAAVVLVALLLGAWLAIALLSHRASNQASNPAIETPATSQPPAETSTAQSPPSSSANGGKGVTRGSIRQKVDPEVSRGAQNTITGRLKVSVQVAVDDAGNVSHAKFVNHGPSQYFANKAMAAAERWKFNPPQVNARPAASEWLLRFQFARTAIEVSPEEVKP
jgi:TonB family protein